VVELKAKKGRNFLIALKGEIYKIRLTKHSIQRGKERGVNVRNIVRAIEKAADRIKTLNPQKEVIPFAIVSKDNNTAIIAKKEQHTIHVVTVLKNKEFQIENVDRVIFL